MKQKNRVFFWGGAWGHSKRIKGPSFNWSWRQWKQQKKRDDLLGDRHRLEADILLCAPLWKGRKERTSQFNVGTKSARVLLRDRDAAQLLSEALLWPYANGGFQLFCARLQIPPTVSPVPGMEPFIQMLSKTHRMWQYIQINERNHNVQGKKKGNSHPCIQMSAISTSTKWHSDQLQIAPIPQLLLFSSSKSSIKAH